LGEEVYFNKFVQYLYFQQIKELKEYANKKAIKLIGDIPIFVSYDSADVWSKPYLFHLNENKERTVVAGVPPDYFSKTGQLWGNPLYNWNIMKSDDYLWWRFRFESLMKQTDLIRLDHFRGFEAYWEIPATENTAINGRWVKGPSYDFFEILKKYFNDLPIIAEDLGVITTEVENLRDNFNFPGMKILQFAFGDSPKNPFLLHNHSYNAFVYTGTHDNSTIKGWYEEAQKSNKKVITELKEYYNINNKYPVWSIIETVFSSVAKTAIIPMQDFLELDDSSRMNTPGTTDGNWLWRMKTLPNKTLSNKIYKSLVRFNRI
jgi:4-alpha-glucanotransferase